MWPRSHFFWDLVSLTHSQHRRWMLTSSFLSRCLSNGLLLFWEAVTRSVLDRPRSRLLGLLATKAAVTGTSMVHDPWLCFLLFCFGVFWCETTCELHNNLIHPHWKHEIHKQGAHKGGLTAFYTYSASFLPISPNWKRYVRIFTVVVSSKWHQFLFYPLCTAYINNLIIALLCCDL